MIDGPGKPGILIIPQPIADEMVRHLEEALPNEGCGLLAVTGTLACPRAVRYFPGANIDQSPNRFTMSPADVLFALTVIDQAGWILGGVVHSHPAGPNTPSPTDLAEARYLSALMIIAGWESGTCSMRAWRIHPSRKNVQEVPIAIAPDQLQNQVDRCAADQNNGSPWFQRSVVDMSTDMGIEPSTLHPALQRDLNGLPDELSRILAPASKEHIRRAASDGGWGAIEILSHLRDREQIYLDQAAAILAEHEPLLPAPDDTLWEIERSYRTQDPDHVLAEFTVLRREFTKLLAALPPESWNRSGRHPQFGQLTLGALAERAREHDRLHIAQLKDALS